jgi:hypothetical protein
MMPLQHYRLYFFFFLKFNCYFNLERQMPLETKNPLFYNLKVNKRLKMFLSQINRLKDTIPNRKSQQLGIFCLQWKYLRSLVPSSSLKNVSPTRILCTKVTRNFCKTASFYYALNFTFITSLTKSHIFAY